MSAEGARQSSGWHTPHDKSVSALPIGKTGYCFEQLEQIV